MIKMTIIEFEKLKEENEQIREEISKMLGITEPKLSLIWIKVNELISNEIDQERECNN